MASAPEHRLTVDAPRRTLGTRPAIAITVTLLVLANLFDNRWVPGWNVVAGPVTAALLIGVLLWSGGTWEEIGLGRGNFGIGARWALALIGIVAAV
jgi:hypothetical protein